MSACCERCGVPRHDCDITVTVRAPLCAAVRWRAGFPAVDSLEAKVSDAASAHADTAPGLAQPTAPPATAPPAAAPTAPDWSGASAPPVAPATAAVPPPVDESAFEVQPGTVVVTVKDARNLSHVLRFSVRESIRDVKRIMEPRIRVPMQGQIVTWSGRSVGDDSTLQELGVAHRSVLYISLRTVDVSSPVSRRVIGPCGVCHNPQADLDLTACCGTCGSEACVVTRVKLETATWMELARLRVQCESCASGSSDGAATVGFVCKSPECRRELRRLLQYTVSCRDNNATFVPSLRHSLNCAHGLEWPAGA